MAKFQFLIFIFFLVFQIQAQVPNSFKIQLLVTDNKNEPILNRSVGLRISILKGSPTGETVFVETGSAKTNNYGLITFDIGEKDPVQFSNIKWQESSYYSQIETDLSGGTNYSFNGISQLFTVPYCEFAQSSEKTLESDPEFQKWDKSTGIKLRENQIIDLHHFKNSDESDPLFKSFPASSISEADLIKWNDPTETDPVFVKSPAKTITGNDILNWNAKSNFNGSFNSLSDVPSFSSVSFSGDYKDIINKPTNIVGCNDGLINKGVAQFDGTNWITITNGTIGQQLTVNSSGLPEWKNPPPETFNDADRPFFEYNASRDYYDCKPWNYNKSINSERTYPLVVYLHCGGCSGDVKNLGLYYLGYDSNDGIDDPRAKAFQINHPSFVLVPQTTAYVWDTSKLISLIEDYKKQYRIDLSRIYIIGYSMGGAGSYLLANDYYDYNKQLFAGIIRLSGQSQSIVRDEIAKKTAIWLHIGLDDLEARVTITKEAYNYLKNLHPNAVETSQNITVAGHSGTTFILTENNKEIVKKTEYNQVGHGINSFPFVDANLIEWLFSQTVE